MRTEDLKVYQAAEALMAEVDLLLRRLPRRLDRTANHLDRSANSVLTNIAEGSAIYRARGKASAYAIARKEAQEVKASLRATVIRRAAREEDVRKPIDLASLIIAMLTRMIINLESRE